MVHAHLKITLCITMMMNGCLIITIGMFNGDELLPDPPTRNPSRGIETCGVVEAMFSYTTLGAASGEWSRCSDSIPSCFASWCQVQISTTLNYVTGDAIFFDRAERVAFNAMPAAWASPRGGDMW